MNKCIRLSFCKKINRIISRIISRIVSKITTLSFLSLVILLGACTAEETTNTTEITPSDTNIPTISTKNTSTSISDSSAFIAYTDSVQTVLNSLKVSQAQAQELSQSMSEMITKAQNQKGNYLETSREIDTDLPKNLSNYLYMKVDSVPESVLPKNTKKLYIGAETEREEQYLYGLSNSGNLRKLAKLPKEFAFNPYKKTQAYYSNGKLFVCSEESYKATIICGIFSFDTEKNILILENQTARDLSVEAIAKAQKEVEKGNIIEAINFYEQVTYPHTYMQVETETIHLLKKSYSVLEKLEREQKYDSATLILERIFDFWGTEFLLNIENPEQLQQLFKANNFELTQKEYITILEKYGSLLLQSKKYVDAVKINKKLTQITPTSAIAYLQLGNAYYHLSRLQDSKNAYKKYKEIIAKTNQRIDKKILEQIEKRLDEK